MVSLCTAYLKFGDHAVKDQQKLNTKVISVENFLSTTTIKSLGAFYFQYIDNFLKFQCLLLCDEEK